MMRHRYTAVTLVCMFLFGMVSMVHVGLLAGGMYSVFKLAGWAIGLVGMIIVVKADIEHARKRSAD